MRDDMLGLVQRLCIVVLLASIACSIVIQAHAIRATLTEIQQELEAAAAAKP